MKWRGIILTGTSGAGKTILSRLLRKGDPAFREVKAVTTREARSDDEPGVYVHLSEGEFDALRADLVIWAEYRGKRYGITRSHIVEVEQAGKVPILVITARSLAEFLERSAGDSAPFLAVFVDAPDAVLDDRLRERGNIDRAKVNAQRVEDRRFRTAATRSLDNLDLDSSLRRLMEWWRAG